MQPQDAEPARRAAIGVDGRIASLDGVRAFAVLTVLAYHLSLPGFAHGKIGVDIFFALSGLLITTLLLQGASRGGPGTARRYRSFLVRRSVRLVPALLTLVVVGLAVTSWVGTPAEQANANRCAAASAGYVMNLSPVENWQCPAVWHVTWSLASEQQFYMLWPLVLLVLLGLGRRGITAKPGAALTAALWGTAALLVLGLCWASWLTLSAPTSRITYAPDTRGLNLLVGCLLALVLARRGERQEGAATSAGLTGRVLGNPLVWLGVLAGMGAWAPRGLPVLLWPLLATVAAAALLLTVLTGSHRSWGTRLLSLPPVVAVGRWSYSIYLFHEIGYEIVSHLMPERGAVSNSIKIALALVLGAAGFFGVERPAQSLYQRRCSRRTLLAVVVVVPDPDGAGVRAT